MVVWFFCNCVLHFEKTLSNYKWTIIGVKPVLFFTPSEQYKEGTAAVTGAVSFHSATNMHPLGVNEI